MDGASCVLFEIIVAMREQTFFGAPLLARLPRLKLVATGMRNRAIDESAWGQVR